MVPARGGTGKPRARFAVAVRGRAGGWAPAALAVLSLLATLLGGGRVGHATAAVDGSAWLWSRAAGEARLVDPDSGRVERRREVTDARGHRVRITQNDRHLLIHDLETGRVSSLDLVGLGLSGRLDVGTRGDPHLAMTATAAAVVERTSGTVRTLDPATLRPVGPVLRLPGPLAGGEFDDTGLLWVAVPRQGTVAAVKVTAAGAAVARTVEVTEPGADLALTVLDRGALVVDRGGRDLVFATAETTRRVTAPVPLAGAMVPERTHGELAAVTVPAARSVVTLGGVRGGPVRSFPLRDPVQDPAVPFAGRVYLPVRETGQVRVYDPAGRQTGVLSMPSGRGDLELHVREGNLFVNSPGSADARVVGADGRIRTVGESPAGRGRGENRTAAPGEGHGPPTVPAPPLQQAFPEPPGASPEEEASPGDDPPAPRHPGTPTPAAPGGTEPSPAAATPGRRTAPSTRAPASPPASRPSTSRPSTSRPSTPSPEPEPATVRNPYTPQQVCNAGSGGGYQVQRSSAFSGGRTYQLYSASTKKNCAVTMKTAGVGTGTKVWVRLAEQTGGEVASDSGTFKYYAGPVYVHAPGDCVRYSGGSTAGSTAAGWANCG
ncbi:hypothetical protein [Actinomadura algeriensis]|uniref:Uncharacterized protein n=1 Tax=Actinomadura algeriensis TaxID=1679523 RepID=A0ABR9JQU9_9ACTN|nr:hypothetical protein [Actinomadura algeriensis]MBE1532858.1 hypothetical protein [Actinomadura algeriensis]